MEFDNHEEVVGLYAFLSGTIHEVAPDIAAKGQWLYTWFFTSIQKLALNFEAEKSMVTMSAESMGAPPTHTVAEVINTPKKRKR